MEVKKLSWKPTTMIYPSPAFMVSCGNNESEHNIITISWAGTLNSNPPMCYISIRPERHSYEIVKKNMELVINLTTKDLVHATDFCGVKSGRDTNKFKETNLTPQQAQVVGCPIIAESPMNIECKVTQIIPLGSHDMFMAEIVAINVTEDLIDAESGALQIEKINLLTYSHGFYFHIGNNAGKFGFSVKKNGKERWRKKD